MTQFCIKSSLISCYLADELSEWSFYWARVLVAGGLFGDQVLYKSTVDSLLEPFLIVHFRLM